MHLSQMLLEMVLPCEPTLARSVTGRKFAAVISDARMYSLVAVELVSSLV